MKFNISLGGRGCDSKVFKITDEQHSYLKESGVEEETLSTEEIEDYLQKDLIFGDFDDSVTGPYLDEAWITVTNETGNEVYNGEPLHENSSEGEWVSVDFEGKENYLVVEEYSKGTFFSFEVESETFDINKLSFIVKELADSREIIIGAKYDGVDVTETKEYGDYWSKGSYYLLSERSDPDSFL